MKTNAGEMTSDRCSERTIAPSAHSILLNDPDFTFINYGTGKDYSYRSTARLHNTRRKLQKDRKRQFEPVTLQDPKRLQIGSWHEATCRGAVSELRQSPSDMDFAFPSVQLERTWRGVFQRSFHLPVLDSDTSGIIKPHNAFLSMAWKSHVNYRSLIVLTVAASEARMNQKSASVVFRNQARVLEDFRMLAVSWISSRKPLTQSDLQHVFTSTFSFLDANFGKENAYLAIMSVNAAVFAIPENLQIPLCPVVEWIRTLMPRPSPMFARSQSFNSIMLAKMNSVLDLLHEIQETAREGYAREIRRYFHPGTALNNIVSSEILPLSPGEPNPGFYSVCFHRILFLLHICIKRINSKDSDAVDGLLTKLENFASECTTYGSTQKIALFLWVLLSDEDTQKECYDMRETLLSWVMRDLLQVHNISFVDYLASWLLWQGNESKQKHMPLALIQSIRTRLKDYYE